jgi:hypothetical protein
MLSITAAPSDRLCHPRSLNGSFVEIVYRRGFSAIAMAPALFVALFLAFAALEHFRVGSIPPEESVALSVAGPFVVVLAFLWAIVVWHGTYVCLSETAISLHETSMFFRTRSRMVPWDRIKDVSLPGRRVVVLAFSEGSRLMIKGIPEPDYLCGAIKQKLSR